MVMPAHQRAMMKGALMCSFSPKGNDPVAKDATVKINVAAKYK
jgi:hypothetical protein